MKNKLNRLAKASSPYLRQHANNPVDWYEWGDEALEKAKKENKPLLISIGYAACHWCHVMARESFMDEHVAKIMNDNFICIKIDREERPDIDQIYMDAALLASGNAGWPLNAFALPDGKPFFASTYFPVSTWSMLLNHVNELFLNEYTKLEEQAINLTKGIAANIPIRLNHESVSDFNIENYNKIFPSLEIMIDKEFGGFLSDQKFPLPVGWEAMLQYFYFMGKDKTFKMIETTLDSMAMGGIFDQIGGGFYRYTVDKYWKVPHFEKMLYDNGQLVSLYSHAYQMTKKTEYAEVVNKTLEFIQSEMMSEERGFYSSLDADSEGEEGKYYIWTKDEIKDILEDSAAELISEYYQIAEKGNWEEGKNILFLKRKKEEFAIEKGLSIEEFNSILYYANTTLHKARSKRIRPSTDDKILTSWNAIMLGGFIDAYKSLGNYQYLDIALCNANFLKDKMIQMDGSILRSYKDRKASITGFLDDYALLADAYIKLYEVTFNNEWLDLSKQMVDYCIQHFYNEDNGMFFYTSDKSENLITRKYQIPDNVIPSSNSVMAGVLYRLGLYFDKEEYTAKSKRMMAQVQNHLVKGGPYYANWAILFGLITHKPYEIATTGPDAVDTANKLQNHYLPSCIFSGGSSEALPLLKDKFIEGKTMIYICRDKKCLLPVEDVEAALKMIEKV